METLKLGRDRRRRYLNEKILREMAGECAWPMSVDPLVFNLFFHLYLMGSCSYKTTLSYLAVDQAAEIEQKYLQSPFF